MFFNSKILLAGEHICSAVFAVGVSFLFFDEEIAKNDNRFINKIHPNKSKVFVKYVDGMLDIII